MLQTPAAPRALPPVIDLSPPRDFGPRIQRRADRERRGFMLGPPPPGFWRIVPLIAGGEWSLFYIIDRLIAAHMGVQ